MIVLLQDKYDKNRKFYYIINYLFYGKIYINCFFFYYRNTTTEKENERN